MSWFNPWDGLKTKMCRYLLQRYLGQFFENNLNLEQLKVDLYNGRAVVENISLKVNAFNDLFEDQGWAFEVVSGHIGCLTVAVPWNALMTNDSSLEISNLTITLRPVTRFQSGTTMLESMWSSVSSSMQMAEECMKQVDDDVPFLNHNNALIGLEKFAETIDNVLNRIKAKLTNTTLNIEYLLPHSDRKLVMSFQASHVDYMNKTGYEMPHQNGGDMSGSQTAAEDDEESIISNFNTLPMIAKHNLVIEGLTIHTSEVLDIDRHIHSVSGPMQYEQLCKIVELKGSQNIQINIKQTENIVGPKVNLEIILDDIYFILSPRQIHLLVEISKGFSNNERPKDTLRKTRGKSIKSTTPPSEYQQHCEPTKMTGILGQNADWSTEPTEYSSYGGHEPTGASRSVYSRNAQRKMCDSASSMVTSCSNVPQELGYTEKSGEILKFKIQISQVFGISLHNDILIQNTASIDSYTRVFDSASYQSYAQTAQQFFQQNTQTSNHLPMENLNYLLVKAAPIIVSGSQQRYFQELTSKTTLSATAVDICEVLDNAIDHLIQFDRQRNCPDGYHIRPEIVLNQSSSFLFKQNHNRCTNKIECIFDECTAELDISIYDRLGALFGQSPFAQSSAGEPENYPEDGSLTEVQVKCENLRLHLRFPVVDGRAANDPHKLPWWKKNVRQDFLSLEFRSLLIASRTHISIMAEELDAFYCDAEKQSAIALLKCQQKNNKKIQIDVLQPRENNNDNRTTDNNKKPKRRSPFSSKCTFGYTTNVEGLDGCVDKTDSLLPGETEEINDFCQSCSQSSKLKVAVYVPLIKVVLESKQMYELIYNRLNGDLFMWEPRSPHYDYQGEEQREHNERESEEEEQADQEEYEKHKYDRSVLLSTSAMESSIYFSMAENTLPKSHAKPNPSAQAQPPNEEAFSFELFVAEGSLILFSHFVEPETQQRTAQCGKFQVNIKEFKLFTVNGLNNDQNRSYFCIQLSHVEALHCGNTQQDLQLAWSDHPDGSLQPTIYNFGQQQHQQINQKRQEVLSVVAEIKKQPDKRIKRMKMSFGINGATLQHHPTSSEHNWLNQLLDFMDVTDFPIEAYVPFALVSEIQLHVWNAAIDYRPKYFPHRALIDIGYCTLSSNIISSMSGCTLRVIGEDCVLSLGSSDSLIPVLNVGLLNISFRLNEDDKQQPRVDLRSSIHDMHLKTCYDSAAALAQLIGYVASDKDLISPEESAHEDEHDQSKFVEPKASEEDQLCDDQTQDHVNKLMADAVMDVECTPGPRHNKLAGKEEGIEIFYFPDEPKDKAEQQRQKNKQKASSTPAKKQKEPGDMQSISLIVESSPSEICNIVDFESNVMLQSYYNQTLEQPLQQVQQELGDVLPPLMEERDFDIIHDDEISRMDKFGVKQIYVSEDPLQIVDNHFCLPHEKVDLLRPPANFPIAESSYTLCEMTFTWHLYGGRDFPEHTTSDSSKKKIPLNPGYGHMSDTYKYGVSQPQGEQKATKKGAAGLPKEPKGSRRNLDVLVEIQLSKIRFSYEAYPLSSIYSSRQVLLVSDIEIRDRLRSSDINKFLYHPNSSNISRRPDENMVIVKALNVRPNPQKSTAEECSLRVSILPIKLNIDQDTLLFLEDFFSALFKNSSGGGSAPENAKTDANAACDMPVMSVSKMSDALQDLEAREIVERNLDVLIDEGKDTTAELEDDPLGGESAPVYFREVIFSPALPICFDYHGRRIELSRGPITGLIMGLAQLQGSGICLREIVNRRGILGWNKLCEFLCKEWLKDIKRNQLPNILSGIGPTNAVLQLFQGVYDLFRLPIEQYNKDGRIIRGFQLGAQSFTARTALAALEITSRIIHLLQFTAETTFDMLSAGPSLKKRHTKRGKKKRQGRPKDLREGVANAYTIVKEGINDSANTLIEAAMTEHDQKGYSGAVGAVVRQIPQLVVCPAVLATQATTNILGGAKSSLVPEAKLEARDKWKHEIH
ncbi:autophagy-related protein 2 homolog A [Drosophila guanche]|uniref:Autophagy-related protein 2 n=1 Tax=Drosophila guanche TaxID=7266 RepID=A0A3B0JWF0_DROGU|nr:autophagy-related protein 2 homolog A [Drosophila guanche]XP_034133413.1 autophagy-related protein 2 homolog A [Drosophila guanche]SPP85413.1 blast:Autophagy-related protein 2 homolog B [Drosophila guanche]